MAELMILEWEGVTTEQYAQVNDELGIHGDADAPDGLIEHVAALTDEGDLVIADLWDSREKLDTFFETRLGPAIHKLALPESEPRFAQVHNHEPGSAEEGRVLILVDVPNGTTSIYDAMRADMPAHADGGDGHPGHVHIAATDGDNMVVADLWPSEEAFGQFAEEQIGPAAQKAGVTDMNMRTLQVHNRIRGKAAVS